MKTMAIAVMIATAGFGQITVPDGTKLRVRLEQTVSSATADEGQNVQLSVTEAVKVGDMVVIPEGAAVTGTVTTAQAKRRMGRAGKLDFSIDRVRCIDSEWIPLRYTINKKNGESHAVRTGVLTAGAAVVFWPAAPVFLLMHGKDVTMNKGMVFDVFTDNNHVLSNNGPVTMRGQAPGMPPAMPQAGAGMPPAMAQMTPGGAAIQPVAATMSAPGSAAVSVTSSTAGSEIEVDGAFVGNTPAVLQLPSGVHRLTVKNGGAVWQRNIQITAGSTVAVYATLETPAPVSDGGQFVQNAARRR